MVEFDFDKNTIRVSIPVVLDYINLRFILPWVVIRTYDEQDKVVEPREAVQEEPPK
jgi:hypothetical protein